MFKAFCGVALFMLMAAPAAAQCQTCALPPPHTTAFCGEWNHNGYSHCTPMGGTSCVMAGTCEGILGPCDLECTKHQDWTFFRRDERPVRLVSIETKYPNSKRVIRKRFL